MNDNYQKITLEVACIDYGYSMARTRFRSFCEIKIYSV